MFNWSPHQGPSTRSWNCVKRGLPEVDVLDMDVSTTKYADIVDNN